MAGSNGPNLNPVAGQVFTYNGPTNQESWENVPPPPVIVNGTSPDAGTLTGAEIVPVSRGAGLLQTAFSTLKSWILSTATSMKIAGDQSLTNTPIGSPLTTNSSLQCWGQTTTTNQEFMVSFQLTSNKASPSLGGNVTLYSAIEGQAGSAGVWALNTVTVLDAGFPYTTQSSFGYELDVNNSAGAYGDFGASNSVGLMLSGLGYRNTCGIFVTTGSGSPLWYYGMRFEVNSVSQATIQDQSSSYVTLDVRGNHTYGVDFGNSPTFLGGAMRIGFGASQGIVSSIGNNTPVPILYANSSGSAFVGAPASNNYANGNWSPAVDVSYNLGSTSNRWANVYAANGIFSGEVQVGGSSGPTITGGTGAPSVTMPNGSLYMRADGATGSRLYVSAGGGTWAAVPGV